MREIFIGIAVPPHVVEVFSAIQQRATGLLRFKEGSEPIVLSHGKSPFHVTLVSPFTTRKAEDDDLVESGLESAGRDLVPFTLTLERVGGLGLETVCVRVRNQKDLGSLQMAVHNRIGRLAPFDFFAHVSLARKFPHGRFPEVLDACERAYSAHRTSFPLSFRVEGLSLFVKEDDGRWKVHTTYHFRGAVAA